MKLVIYNNKSGYSTVLDAFLKTAQKEFEEIYVFFPRKVRIDDYSVYKNIKFFNCTVISFLISFFESTLQIFTKDTICDLKTALRKKKFCINYVKIYFIQLFKANALFRESKKIVKKQHKEGVSLFSTWYAENAIAAAKMKKIYPEIYAASYAHSYEIDFRKNNYVGLLRDRFKERYLDKICFISKNVMEEYKLLNSDILKRTDKYEAMHFGSKKMYRGFAKASDDGIFRILTCSGISAVKRLDLLISALKQYKGEQKICWTHLGTGPDEEKVKKLVEDLQKNIQVCFKGKVSHQDVHKYYIENFVDLFVNISSSEGLPVSIMEAMSYSVPVLATDVGGNSEIVTDETGYLVNANIQPEDLVEIIENIVGNKSELIQKKSAAYKMWKTEYQIEPNVEKMIRILDNDYKK